MINRNGNTFRRKGLGILFLLLLAASCGPNALNNSDLSIRNGQHMIQNDKNTAPGLVSIGGCSATLVSTNTLITAAHCTTAGAKVCIRSGEWSGTCSNKTYIPVGYRILGYGVDQNNMRYPIMDYGWDIAVVVFDGQPFKNFFKVATVAPKVKDPVVMVGYSEYRNNQPQLGSKRWGLNTITRINGNEMNSIYTEDGGKMERTAVDKGDSGGTMLNNRCELIGVTSRNHGDNGSASIHTSTTHAAIKQWLSKMITTNQAHICGLPGTDPAYCPASGTGTPDPNPAPESNGRRGFPCAPSTTNTNTIHIALAGDDTAAKMFISVVAQQGVTVAACANTTPEQCLPVAQNRYFPAQYKGNLGNRSIFEVGRTFIASDSQATWSIVSRNANGQIIQVHNFKLDIPAVNP